MFYLLIWNITLKAWTKVPSMQVINEQLNHNLS